MPPDRRTLRDIRDASPTDLAYIAGILDGEGTIGFKTQGRQNYGYVWIYNSDKALIDWISEWGGTVTQSDKGQNGLQKLRMYRWSVQNNEEVSLVLQALLPYLRVKREKACRVLGVILEWQIESLFRKKVDGIRKSKILTHHSTGANPYQISKMVGCSRHAVVRTLEREGLR